MERRLSLGLNEAVLVATTMALALLWLENGWRMALVELACLRSRIWKKAARFGSIRRVGVFWQLTARKILREETRPDGRQFYLNFLCPPLTITRSSSLPPDGRLVNHKLSEV